MADIEDFPEWFGGAIAVLGARAQARDKASKPKRLNPADVGTNKASQWASETGRSSDSNLSAAHSALRKKFPGMAV